MKIDGIPQIPHTNSIKKSDIKPLVHKDFSSILNVRNASSHSMELPKTSSKEMIQNFAEWYLKQGKTYESTKSYKMAISAYEKSNSVQPDVTKGESIDDARKKAYHG